jgi:hypothetical protein
VQQLAALGRSKTRLGALHLARGEAMVRERAERTCGLVDEDPGAALRCADVRRRERIAAPGDRARPAARGEERVAPRRERRDRKRRSVHRSDIGYERTHEQLAVALGTRAREHDLGRRLAPRRGEPGIEGERALGRGLRNAGLALQPDGNQRLRARREGPGVVGEAAHPEVIEREAGRLEDAEHLHRRRSRCGLERGLRGEPLDARARLGRAPGRRHGAEGRERGDDLAPLRERLELARIERALSRESGRLEQVREAPRPVVRGRAGGLLRRFQQAIEGGDELRAIEPAAPFGLGGDEAAQPREREHRRGHAPQRHVEPRARGHLALGAGDEGRAQQAARPVERDRAGGELEHAQRRVHERRGREWRRERDVEAERTQHAREDAHHLRAPLLEVGHHDRDRGARPRCCTCLVCGACPRFWADREKIALASLRRQARRRRWRWRRPLLQPGARPSRRGLELLPGRLERHARELRARRWPPALEHLRSGARALREEIGLARRHEVEGVEHDRRGRLARPSFSSVAASKGRRAASSSRSRSVRRR